MFKILNIYCIMIDGYISVSEYAKLKEITVQAVYQAVKRKTIDSKKIGKITLVKKD